MAGPSTIQTEVVADRENSKIALWSSLAVLGGITLGEVLTTYADPRIGLITHSVLLFALFALAYRAREQGSSSFAFLVSLAFAPLIRIISLSLPLRNFPPLYWYFITSLPLFAALWISGRTLGYSWVDLGLNLRDLPSQLAIGVTGLGLGAMEYVILQPKSLADQFTFKAMIGPALVLLISTGLLEEMIFRGLQQATAIKNIGRFGIPYVALVFALLHIGYKSLLDMVFVLFVGLVFGWAVERTKSIIGVTIAHGLTNIMLFLFMPFLVLGNPTASESLMTLPQALNPGLPEAILPAAAHIDEEHRAQMPSVAVVSAMEREQSGLTPTVETSGQEAADVSHTALVPTPITQPVIASTPISASIQPITATVVVSAIPPVSTHTVTTSTNAMPALVEPTPASIQSTSTVTDSLLTSADSPVVVTNQPKGNARAVAIVTELFVRSGPAPFYPMDDIPIVGSDFDVVARSADMQWYAICCTSEGNPGWVTGEWIRLTGSIETLPVVHIPAYAVVIADGTGMYEFPDPQSDMLITLNQTGIYKVIGKDTTGAWWRVCCVDGHAGWLAASAAMVAGDVLDVKVITSD